LRRPIPGLSRAFIAEGAPVRIPEGGLVLLGACILQQGVCYDVFRLDSQGQAKIAQRRSVRADKPRPRRLPGIEILKDRLALSRLIKRSHLLFGQTPSANLPSLPPLSVSDVTGTIVNDGWVLEFDLDAAITNLWNGVITSHVGKHYVIAAAS
jgi:hypothetical protein